MSEFRFEKNKGNKSLKCKILHLISVSTGVVFSTYPLHKLSVQVLLLKPNRLLSKVKFTSFQFKQVSEEPMEMCSQECLMWLSTNAPAMVLCGGSVIAGQLLARLRSRPPQTAHGGMTLLWLILTSVIVCALQCFIHESSQSKFQIYPGECIKINVTVPGGFINPEQGFATQVLMPASPLSSIQTAPACLDKPTCIQDVAPPLFAIYYKSIFI